MWYHFNEKAPGEQTANNAKDNPDILNAADTATDGKSLAAYGRNFNTAHFGGGSFPYACPLYGKALDYGMKWRDGVAGEASDENSCLNFITLSNQWSVVVLPDDEKIHLATFTVEFFFRFDPDIALDSTGVRICQLYNNGKIDDGGKFAWQFSINGSGTGIGINVHDASGEALIAASSAIPCRQFKDGQWHHIAMTLDGDGNLKVYLDYELLKTFEGISIAYGTSGTDTLTIGSAALSYGYFRGAIDEFRLSDTALEPDQFLHMTKPFGDEDVLVYIPCDRTNLTACGVNNVNVAGPGTVPAKVQTITTGGKLPEAVTDQSSILSERIRWELLATNDFANGSSYLFATNAGATAAGQTATIALADVVNGVHSFFDHDGTTLEMFFKADAGGAANNQGFWSLDAYSTRSFIRSGTDGNSKKIQTYIAQESGMPKGSWETWGGTSVRDGKWHHLAWVFDRTKKEMICYLDYAKHYAFTNCLMKIGGVSDSTAFYVCGYEYSSSSPYGFCGQFDEIRITKRALLPREFLTTKELPQAKTPTAFYAAFDGDYKNLVFPNDLAAGAKSGTVTFSEKVPGETVPVKADMGFSEITNRSALAIAQGGSIAYNAPISIEGLGDQTVEFYAKIDPSVPDWATILCYQFIPVTTNEVYTEAVWSDIWRFKLDGSKNLNVVVGTDAVKGKSRAFDTPSLVNGRWHHLAATFAATVKDAQPATEVRVYLDREELGGVTVPGRMLRRVNHQSGMLRVGCPGDWGTTMVGGIDELRISNAVLTPDEFLAAVRNPRGMILIVK